MVVANLQLLLQHSHCRTDDNTCCIASNSKIGFEVLREVVMNVSSDIYKYISEYTFYIYIYIYSRVVRM
jgi:hypothetical protein